MRAFSLVSGSIAATLGISALVLIPVCSGEGWKGDSIVTVMLLSSFLLFWIACHGLDRSEKPRF
jgi:TRAP-type C4-dicarboxylate transport system permease large subunit